MSYVSGLFPKHGKGAQVEPELGRLVSFPLPQLGQWNSDQGETIRVGKTPYTVTYRLEDNGRSERF